MRSALDSARESDARDFCMMGPPMQDGKAKAWLDERMTGSAPLLCAAAIKLDRGPMSALGQKRTSGDVRLMSALPPKADITSAFYEYTP
jgi:hypothetical protein